MPTAQPKRGGKAGMGVDALGGPVIDPTENVIALNEAANKRQDDLREAERRLTAAEQAHSRELAAVREEHQDALASIREQHSREMRNSESARVDANRATDLAAVGTAAAQALAAIQALAATATTTADTLRNTVAATALTAENRQVAFATDQNKRLSALELSMSEGKGKQTVADPQLERLAVMVEQLASRQASSSGKSEGLSDGWKMLIAAVGLFATLSALGVFDRKAVPAVQAPVYFAAPSGTMVPSPNTNPAQVPR
jgi:hypothetical protein